MGLTSEYLLHLILRFYADPDHWLPDTIRSVCQTPKPSAIVDGGRIARMAILAISVGSAPGGLLPIVCDCFSIPFPILIQKSKLDPARVMFIANGADMTEEESAALLRALRELVPR